VHPNPTTTPDVRLLQVRDLRRALLAGLESLLDNWSLDVTFINTRDLRAEHGLRDGRISDGALADFVVAIERELGGAR
jgi:hypothetical protein